MYYYGQIVEGIIRIPSYTILNERELGEPMLIVGKFVMYGEFVERSVTRSEELGKSETITEYEPIAGVVFSKVMDYIMILSSFISPKTGDRYAYLSLSLIHMLKQVLNTFKFWDIFTPDIDRELEEYEIEV